MECWNWQLLAHTTDDKIKIYKDCEFEMGNNIAVLMTCFNRKDKTLKSLESLFRQNADVDVYLVNDGCTDGTHEAVTLQFPQVNIIRGTGSLFWNRGMHLAWTTAVGRRDYDHFLWLNDDTMLYPDAIQELMKCSESEHQKCSGEEMKNVEF